MDVEHEQRHRHSHVHVEAHGWYTTEHNSCSDCIWHLFTAGVIRLERMVAQTWGSCGHIPLFFTRRDELCRKKKVIGDLAGLKGFPLIPHELCLRIGRRAHEMPKIT